MELVGYSLIEIQKWIGRAYASTAMNIYVKVKESKKQNTGDKMGRKFSQAI